jgi:hypothetical protein
MPSMDAKHKRAMQARINGAKSKGAKTAEGQHRTRTASLQHGLYATPDTLRHTVDPISTRISAAKSKPSGAKPTATSPPASTTWSRSCGRWIV